MKLKSVKREIEYNSCQPYRPTCLVYKNIKCCLRYITHFLYAINKNYKGNKINHNIKWVIDIYKDKENKPKMFNLNDYRNFNIEITQIFIKMMKRYYEILRTR